MTHINTQVTGAGITGALAGGVSAHLMGATGILGGLLPVIIGGTFTLCSALFTKVDRRTLDRIEDRLNELEDIERQRTVDAREGKQVE